MIKFHKLISHQCDIEITRQFEKIGFHQYASRALNVKSVPSSCAVVFTTSNCSEATIQSKYSMIKFYKLISHQCDIEVTREFEIIGFHQYASKASNVKSLLSSCFVKTTTSNCSPTTIQSNVKILRSTFPTLLQRHENKEGQ